MQDSALEQRQIQAEFCRLARKRGMPPCRLRRAAAKY